MLAALASLVEAALASRVVLATTLRAVPPAVRAMGAISALAMLRILPASVSGRARRTPLALLSALTRLPALLSTATSLGLPAAAATIVGVTAFSVRAGAAGSVPHLEVTAAGLSRACFF